MFSKIKISRMWFSIGFSFVYVMVYLSGILIKAPDRFIFGLFLGSPLILLWVVISILKDSHEPKKTFDEYFYEKEELKRNHEVHHA